MWALGIVLSWFVFIVSGCSSGGSGESGIRWSPCPDVPELECGRLEVPLDHADPAGERIELALARIPAQDQERRIGVVLVNPGGPGASGVAVVKGKAGSEDAAFKRIAERFDIVGWDPRGVGSSTRVLGPERLDWLFAPDPVPATLDEREVLNARLADLGRSAEALNGRLLAFVDTDSTVRDMDLIRAALGEARISFIGMSYGTLVGARYADRFPGRVRAFVLDGAVDPAMSGFERSRDQVLAHEQVLVQRLEACGRDPSCPFFSGGDPLAAFDDLWSRVAAGLVVDATGRAMGIGELGYAVSILLQGGPLTTDWEEGPTGDLEGLLALAATGEPEWLTMVADMGTGREPDPANPTVGIYPDGGIGVPTMAIGARDGYIASTEADFDRLYELVRTEAPRVRPPSLTLGRVIPFWPVGQTANGGPIRAAGAQPILVIGGVGDPATPWPGPRRWPYSSIRRGF